MTYQEEDLLTANRHVLQAESHIVRQKQIIDELIRGGHPIDLAMTLLCTFERTLVNHERHRDQIAAELDQKN